jgi:hypothetical protein
MLGIFLLFCVLAVLGFILSWITGVVAREEIEIKTSMGILFLTGIVTIVVGFATADLGGAASTACRLLASLTTLALLVKFGGRLSWKHSVIIAVVFSMVLNLIAFGIAAMLAH